MTRGDGSARRMSFNAPYARPAPYRSFECPFDGNDCLAWERRGWYWWHCPACGARFTLNGTLVPGAR